MMEEKKKETRFSKKQVWGCIGLLCFLCFGIFGLMLLLPSFVGKIPQKALHPDEIEMAEAALSNPTRITVSEKITLSLLQIEDYSDSSDALCVHLAYSTDSNIRNNSSLFIDGVWIIGASFTFVPFVTDGNFETMDWCATGELQAGIHLVEFHLKDSFWGEAIHIQQWAIEIE